MALTFRTKNPNFDPYFEANTEDVDPALVDTDNAVEYFLVEYVSQDESDGSIDVRYLTGREAGTVYTHFESDGVLEVVAS